MKYGVSMNKFFHKITLLSLIFIFFLSGISFALPQWPHEKSDLSPDPEVVWGKLENGFRYVLMKNSVPEKRVSMHLNVQVGSLNEQDNERGIAHFLEHMLFQGTKHFDPGDLIKYFQSIGMQFGPDVNAHTGFRETVYDIILPDGNQKSLEDGILVMKDYAQNALLLSEEIDKERNVILAEKRYRDSARYRTFESTLKFEFPDALISKRLPIGIEKVINTADRKLIKGFYDAWYRPETMMIVMVGDFEIQMASPMIETIFSDITARASVRNMPNLGEIHHKGIIPFFHFEEKVGDASLSIEVLKMIENKPDTESSRKNRLTKNIADAVVQNRLDQLLRKPENPFTKASINSGVFLNQIFYGEISAKSSPENWENALVLMEQELRKALRFKFTVPELDRVKKDYIASLKTMAQKAGTRNTRQLARQIIGSVNSNQVFMSPKQILDLYLPIIENLTPASVHEAFRETWLQHHRLILVTGNAVMPNTERPESYILRVMNQSRNQEVTPPKEMAAVKFPYLPEPENIGSIAEKKEDPDLGIVRIDFNNGVRLNYKKTNFKDNEILVNLSFGHGESGEPQSKPGLSELANDVINESGTGTLDRNALNRALAGKSTSVFFNVDEDDFEFYGDTVPDEIPLMFQLLRSYLIDPGFRREAFELAMKRYHHSYLQKKRSVEGILEIKGQRFLAGGDKRFGLSDYSVVQHTTLEDISSWIKNAITTAPIEISVVGDFDPEILVQNVLKYIGSLPPRNNEIQTRPDSPEFPTDKSLKLSAKTEIPKGIVLMAYPTDDIWNIHTTRRLSVLSDVVSEKLRLKIREDLGASYSPYAYNHPSKAYSDYGVFRIVVPADPDQTGKLLKVIKGIVDELNKAAISDDELTRALKPTLTSIEEMRQKNTYWLNSVLADCEKHPEQIDWAKTIISDYSAITPKQIWDTAKSYLHNRSAAQIVVLPEK
jgi:zinc protease